MAPVAPPPGYATVRGEMATPVDNIDDAMDDSISECSQSRLDNELLAASSDDNANLRLENRELRAQLKLRKFRSISRKKYQTVPRPNRRATVYFGRQLISVSCIYFKKSQCGPCQPSRFLPTSPAFLREMSL